MLWRYGSLETKPRGWSDPPHGSRGAIYGALVRQEARRSGCRISESFVASLKCEILHRHRFLSREAARTAVFDYIESFYNGVRRHSSLGYLSPSDYEKATMKEVVVA